MAAAIAAAPSRRRRLFSLTTSCRSWSWRPPARDLAALPGGILLRRSDSASELKLLSEASCSATWLRHGSRAGSSSNSLNIRISVFQFALAKSSSQSREMMPAWSFNFPWESPACQHPGGNLSGDLGISKSFCAGLASVVQEEYRVPIIRQVEALPDQGLQIGQSEPCRG